MEWRCGVVGYRRPVLSETADHLQARHLIRYLSDERTDLARKLTMHARILNDAKTAARAGAISHHRSCIRRIEADLRNVNAMVDALIRRFPDAGSEISRPSQAPRGRDARRRAATPQSRDRLMTDYTSSSASPIS